MYLANLLVTNRHAVGFDCVVFLEPWTALAGGWLILAA